MILINMGHEMNAFNKKSFILSKYSLAKLVKTIENMKAPFLLSNRQSEGIFIHGVFL